MTGVDDGGMAGLGVGIDGQADLDENVPFMSWKDI